MKLPHCSKPHCVPLAKHPRRKAAAKCPSRQPGLSVDDTWLLTALWQEPGFANASRQLLRIRRQFGAERRLRVMVVDLPCDPGSKAAILRCLEGARVPEVAAESVTRQHLWRTIDTLAECGETMDAALAALLRPMIAPMDARPILVANMPARPLEIARHIRFLPAHFASTSVAVRAVGHATTAEGTVRGRALPEPSAKRLNRAHAPPVGSGKSGMVGDGHPDPSGHRTAVPVVVARYGTADQVVDAPLSSGPSGIGSASLRWHFRFLPRRDSKSGMRFVRLPWAADRAGAIARPTPAPFPSQARSTLATTTRQHYPGHILRAGRRAVLPHQIWHCKALECPGFVRRVISTKWSRAKIQQNQCAARLACRLL